MREELTEVGQVRKTHGYAGEVKLAVAPGYESDVETAAFLFVGTSPESCLPYEITRMRGADHIATLDGVNTREEAALLRGRGIYLKSADVSDLHSQSTSGDENINEEYKRFVGFAMIDVDKGEIGSINKVEAYPQQSMALVKGKEDEHLVPLNRELIRGIDFTKRIVFVQLPEGLLEL